MKFSRFPRVIIYLILLGASWLAMSNREIPLPDGGLWHELTIPGKNGNPALLRYRKIIGTSPGLPPLILIHGSPMASSCFDPMLEQMKQDRTILVPDLPGFGASSIGFSDYSFPGHADALRRLINHEKVKAAHWVAYSQGGGPVLELAAKSPDVFSSLTLLSGIGVQEHELTGDYFLNHVLHGAQWIALEAIRWGVPHFGLFDAGLLNTRYARNFLDSDLRPLRGILETFAAPVLIIQGKSDMQVTASSAREHFRIIPQSEIKWLDGGHIVLMSDAGTVAREIESFAQSVDAGNKPTRDSASATRIAESSLPFDPSTGALDGPALWLILTIIALATLASEDLTCLAAGLLVARGLIPLPAGISACFAGIWIGDMGLYGVGRYFGRWCLTKAPLRWMVSEGALDAGRDFLARKGGVAILMSRFTPGMRLPLYLAAGVVKMDPLKLGLWFLIAGLLWTIPMVSLAAVFGEKVTEWLLKTGAAVFPAAVGLVLLSWILLRLATTLATHRGRRILLAKWARLTRWEFWPPLVFYPPVVISMLIMGMRRRNLLAFTAVNPAIPHGGISGESKTEILNHLTPSGVVAPFVSLPSTLPNKHEVVSQWRRDFPLVVKPDVGERGSGVVIVHNEEELSREIESRSADTIVQEYVPGAEFGIFYIRRPHEEKGRIFSITIKVMTSVTGDGERTLEELILDDNRAFLSHRHFFEIHQEQLGEIPNAGRHIPLAKLGSHCRGALFLNGIHLKTPELETEIDRIARCFKGFHFGRFDLRCPDEASLTRGEGIRVIELNGVTSEATHIYHPHTPLIEGYRTLISQWREAYDIGIANAALGAKVSTWREVRDLISDHFNRKSN